MCAPVRECPSRFRDFGAALSDARSLHGPLLSPCSLPRRWVHLISPRASHSHSSLTSQGTRPQSPLHPAVGQPLRWVLVAGRPYPDRPILLVRVPRLFHAASLESLEAATAARPTFPRRCGVYRLRARHVAIGAPGSDGNKLTVVGVGWRLAHAREHLRLVAATELGMVAIDKWLVSSALWVGSALQLLYGRVQDACCSHLFDVLCCLHWTAHFPAFMAACGARAARRFSGWQRCEPSRCRLHRGLLLGSQRVGRVGGLRARHGREYRVRGVACACVVYGTQRCRRERGALRPLMIF
jgi:hypothetical protein